MASATTASEPDSSFLSMRTSCDRCRKQKLKCFVGTPARNNPSGASVSCQRCARAAVPCVFGRRSRSTRATHAAGGSVGPSSDLKPTGSASISPITPNVPQDPHAAHSTDSPPAAPSPTAQTASSLEHFAFEDTDWNQLLSGANVGGHLEYLFLEDNAISASPLFSPHDMSHPFHMEEDDLLSMTNIGPTITHATSTTFENPGPENLTVDTTPVRLDREQATSQALRLASTLHETLEALNTCSWLSNSGTEYHCLDNYPIGRVLHSSQELASLASSLQTVDSGTVSERSGPSASNTDGAIPDTMCLTPASSIKSSRDISPPDKALSLLLLSCFISLTRIYTVVLRHFQGHLNHTLDHGPEMQHETNADMAPTLHLSELPSENSPLTRMHTALRMLVDSLRLAEEALCFPTRTRFAVEQGQQDTITARFTSLIPQDLVTASDFQEDYAALETMVFETKGLLRERMGL
ncbi:hypothetical protein Daus18300_003226 [Diaporthe australafricana]|uniref:Zn(2)-C6 fungal-type domain-containing protein n=1 Tax=Diaporthe australafricana TaxID=127596 RepID=A0ABR3XHR6_9PEZI